MRDIDDPNFDRIGKNLAKSGTTPDEFLEKEGGINNNDIKDVFTDIKLKRRNRDKVRDITNLLG